MRKYSQAGAAVAALLIVAAGQSFGQAVGPSSSQTPYMTPIAPGVQTQSLLTVGDAVGSYHMVGIPDGMGAIDNGDTFILTMNHELLAGDGMPRAHGSVGAFVSRWEIDKATRTVLSGADLITTVYQWDPSTNAYVSGTTVYQRFCSADVPAASAFYNAATGLGTQERIHMNGEEVADGRAWASIITGSNAGQSWQLPALGKLAWENSLACPFVQDTTIVAGDDDSTPGQVYFYVGTKTNTGNEIERAGLTNGHLYGLSVNGVALEDRLNGIGGRQRFTLAALPDARNLSGADLETASNTAGVTKFNRPEDGAWDPTHPNNYYFVTTDRLDQVNDGIGPQIGRSRLWHAQFDDIANPLAGGSIEALFDTSSGPNMMDNICIDRTGHILIVEDVGNAAHNGKVWMYTIASHSLVLLAQHDQARFGDLHTPATPPFNQDEEFSGIFDASDFIGPGWFIVDDQAHYAQPGELVEGGQLLAVFNPTSVPCAVDWNADGILNSQDFFDFLTSFFADNADFNHNGVTNSQDFFDFVAGFFTGCGE